MPDDREPTPIGVVPLNLDDLEMRDLLGGYESSQTMRPRPAPISAGGSPDVREALSLCISLVFSSKSGGPPHVVTIVEESGRRVAYCTCKARLGGEGRCWAAKAARSMLLIPD